MITSFAEYVDLLDNQEHPLSRRAIIEAVSEDVLFRTVQERPDLKQDVILNKFVPTSILDLLVDDPNAHVRYWVAKKNKLLPIHLEKLVHDSNDGVRRAVVYHKKLSKQLLELLAQDEEDDIAERARQRLGEGDYQD